MLSITPLYYEICNDGGIREVGNHFSEISERQAGGAALGSLQRVGITLVNSFFLKFYSFAP